MSSQQQGPKLDINFLLNPNSESPRRPTAPPRISTAREALFLAAEEARKVEARNAQNARMLRKEIRKAQRGKQNQSKPRQSVPQVESSSRRVTQPKDDLLSNARFHRTRSNIRKKNDGDRTTAESELLKFNGYAEFMASSNAEAKKLVINAPTRKTFPNLEERKNSKSFGN